MYMPTVHTLLVVCVKTLVYVLNLALVLSMCSMRVERSSRVLWYQKSALALVFELFRCGTCSRAQYVWYACGAIISYPVVPKECTCSRAQYVRYACGAILSRSVVSKGVPPLVPSVLSSIFYLKSSRNQKRRSLSKDEGLMQCKAKPLSNERFQNVRC